MIENFVAGLSQYLSGSYALAFLAVYLGGVLVSFTPCVYPVAPITIAFIGSHSSGSKLKGFALSLLYVFGMAVTYTILGGVAASSGKLFGQIQTNPWLYVVMANLCLFMGLSMLDVFSLPVQTPQFITRAQPRKKRKGILGSFIIGAASGLIIGPCTAPVLFVLLGYVASRQNTFFGMTLLFLFAFGMGTTLIILGTFVGLLANIPKSGEWMTRISHICGWILIGAGEYFLFMAGTFWI
ncbi:MAG: sulfite exporter TauE/SafE family protein [Deltaproteobacteria bacterium]|nr:sulfite exporter TauE/SafE family protein [Deltaproteobacteria bacterium]